MLFVFINVWILVSVNFFFFNIYVVNYYIFYYFNLKKNSNLIQFQRFQNIRIYYHNKNFIIINYVIN